MFLHYDDNFLQISSEKNDSLCFSSKVSYSWSQLLKYLANPPGCPVYDEPPQGVWTPCDPLHAITSPRSLWLCFQTWKYGWSEALAIADRRQEASRVLKRIVSSAMQSTDMELDSGYESYYCSLQQKIIMNYGFVVTQK